MNTREIKFGALVTLGDIIYSTSSRRDLPLSTMGYINVPIYYVWVTRKNWQPTYCSRCAISTQDKMINLHLTRNSLNYSLAILLNISQVG